MTARNLPTLLAVVVCSCLIAVPAAQAKTPRCSTKAPTVAASETLRVFATGKGDVHTRDLWACRRGRDKAVFLFDGARNETWSSLRFAGDRYASVIGEYTSPVDGLVDIDAHRVDVTHRHSSDWSTPLRTVPSDLDVALADDGTIALIDRSTVETVVISRFGQSFSSPALTLDTGVPAQLSQLATRSGRLYWLNNGAARTVAPGSTTVVSGPILPAPVAQYTGLAPKAGNRCDAARGITSIATLGGRIFVRPEGRGSKRVERVSVCRRGGGRPMTALKTGDGDAYGGLQIAGAYALVVNGRVADTVDDSLDSTDILAKVTFVVRDLRVRKVVAARTDFALTAIPDVVLASSGRYGYVRGTTVIVPGAGAPAEYAAESAEPDLAAASAAIYWIGADGLPHVSS